MSIDLRIFRPFIQSLFGMSLFIVSLTIIGYPATFTVNNTGDAVDVVSGNGVCETGTGNGVCTLRAAVQEANDFAGNDTIQFSAMFNSPQIISLSSGQITIFSNLTITGTSAKLLIIQNTAPLSTTSRVFEIVSGTVSLSGMTITGGNVDGNGGGISYTDIGTFSLTNCVVTGNTATGFGGGIRAISTVNIINSTISFNTANGSHDVSGGGGIDHGAGSLTVTNSTISNNTKNGGDRNGGGIWTSAAAATITSSTITKNFTLPGVISAGGVHWTNNGQTMIIRNSIIAGNQGLSTIPDITGGTFSSNGFNIVGIRSGSFNSPDPTDQVGTASAPLNPKLGALADNGGPTPTHAILAGSPALDKGSSFGLPTDQRGLARTYNSPQIPNTDDGTDIGAVERQAAETTFIAPFDFDGDGKTDISIFRPANGQWWLNRSTGGVFATTFGTGTDKITPGDFTGDGKTDIAFWRPSTGFWFILRSENLTFYSVPYGTSGDVPVPADYDSDNITDLAVFRPSNSLWFIHRSSTGADTSQQFGQNGDVPAVADYDNDSRADLAIYRPAPGEWWIQRSTAGLIAYQFGNSSDRPTPGDFTGDGKADVAFWRPSTGFWFVLRSEDTSFFSFPFGTGGDIPAPGDYDGDGKFDATVFRPSTTTWYVRQSTSGVLIQNFGANGDLPVPNAFVP